MIVLLRYNTIKKNLKLHKRQQTRKMTIIMAYFFQERTTWKTTILYFLLRRFLKFSRLLLHLFPLSMIMYPRRLPLSCSIKFKEKSFEPSYLRNAFISTKSVFCPIPNLLPSLPIWKECFLNKRWEGNGRHHLYSFFELFQG